MSRCEEVFQMIEVAGVLVVLAGLAAGVFLVWQYRKDCRDAGM